MIFKTSDITHPILLLLQISSLLLLQSITFSNALTTAEIQELLNIHNKLRAGEGSSNMQVMKWNSNLAFMAQDWANRCKWAHGQSINSSSLSDLNVGQNMYQGSVAKVNLTSAVMLWFNEKQYFNYTNNSCAAGQVCGHYTQVVWSESSQLGCGYATCSSAKYVVCNYGPAGNYAGLLPYKKGPACTACSSGSFYCTMTGLCDNGCKAASSNCVCKVACKNCGKATTNCRCQCTAGWSGVDCSEICRNKETKCDPPASVVGWPKNWCDAAHQFVIDSCPLMCEKCVPAPCLPGFTFLKDTGGCYLLTSKATTQLDAQKDCAAKGSRLVYIETAAELNALAAFWQSKFPGQSGAGAWIGACRVGSNPTPFVWSPACSQTGPPTGTVTSPMTFTKWLPPLEPNNGGYDPKKPGSGEWCVEMYNITSVGYIWNDLPCNETRSSYICEAVCPPGFTFLKDTGGCYLLTSKATTQLDAQKDCAAKGSRLVYIETAAELNALAAFWQSKFPGQSGVGAWIGACRVGSNPTPFVWSPACSQTGPPTGTVTSPMTFTKWLPPLEPNNGGYDPKKPGSGEWCVEMYNITSVGYIWNDLPCNETRSSYICEAGC